MRELAVAVAELTGYAVVGLVLTTLGLFAEWLSLSYLAAGNTMFAAWLVFMGAVALYAGIVGIGVGEVLPRLHTVRE